MDKPIFQRATKQQAKLRLAIQGPSGSGKTYTGLILATVLANGSRVAVIDTEHGSSAKYADVFDFDILELHTFAPKNYAEAIGAAEEAGYSVLLIDSFSHEWEGAGGIMEAHDQAAEKSGNSWAAWRDPTKLHRQLVDRMLQSSCHIICTMRAKTEWFQNADKKIIEKKQVGTVQRPGMEYEFDIVLDLDYAHTMTVSKSRFTAIADVTESKPNAKWFERIRRWLSEGAPKAEEHQAEQPKVAETAQPPTEAPKALPTDGNGKEKPKAETMTQQEVRVSSEPNPAQLAADWTRSATERGAFKAFRTKYTLSDTDCKRLAGKALGQDKPLTYFREFPGERAALELAILNQLEIESAKKEPAHG